VKWGYSGYTKANIRGYLKQEKEEREMASELEDYNDPCRNCPNRLRNGEFKACNCTLPYYANPIT
jgi:hypothetical protein